MARRIAHLGKQQVELEEFTPAEPAGNQIRLRSLCSLMSSGTETIVYHRLFDDGTHWDQWVQYPFYLGYATVGEIVETGADVAGLEVGQRVAVREPHASEIVVDADQAYPLPDGLDPRQATWFALGKIAWHGIMAAEPYPGQTMAVVGAGPLGQILTRWAYACGVDRILVVDTIAERLEMASAGGATDVFAKPIEQAGDDIRRACGGDGPDVCVDVTGHPAVLAPALAVPRRLGRVVLLGDTGRPAGQHLTGDVVIRGVRIVGAHDSHNTERWHDGTIVPLFLRMAAAGRIRLDGLITHTFSPADPKEAYEFAGKREPGAMGILFDWTALD